MAPNTNNPNTNSDEKLKWSFSEKWGFTIIGLGVILLFIFIGTWLLGGKPSPESHHIHIYLTEDTISNNTHHLKYLYNHSEVDSMVKVLQNHEALLEQKYQYVMEQKEEEDRFKTYLAIIASIILSIAAFFGFKTISDLKKQCREEASAIASQISEDTATTAAEKKADEVARTKADEVAKSKAAEVAETKATEIAEKKAVEVAEAKAAYIAEKKAEAVAEAKATEVAETKAAEIAGLKAATVAEEIATGIAESIAATKAQEVAEKKAIEAASEKAKEISQAVAKETGEAIAKTVTIDYLKLNFEKTVSEQLTNIQKTEVFQWLKKENETFIKLEIDKLRPSVEEAQYPAPDNPGLPQDFMDPTDLNFDSNDET